MKTLKYFFQYILIKIFFYIFKILGYKNASNFGAFIGLSIGPFLKSKKIIKSNLKNFSKNIDDITIDKISKKMWENYGRIFAEYIFLKDFRSEILSKHIQISGIENLIDIPHNRMGAR